MFVPHDNRRYSETDQNEMAVHVYVKCSVQPGINNVSTYKTKMTSVFSTVQDAIKIVFTLRHSNYTCAGKVTSR